MNQQPDLNALVRKMWARQKALEGKLKEVGDYLEECAAQPRSITDEIDAIPGRRIFYTLGANINFTAADDGLRGNPLVFAISQDGPFIATHYPLVLWRPNLPANAANFGAWRPVSTWPLPDQVLDIDLVDLSYEIADGGAQRNFQNTAVGPLFSRPDNAIPLPVPTLFAPNTTVSFFPTYERIVFAGDPATTQGNLYVGFPGYKIVNL